MQPQSARTSSAPVKTTTAKIDMAKAMPTTHVDLRSTAQKLFHLGQRLRNPNQAIPANSANGAVSNGELVTRATTLQDPLVEDGCGIGVDAAIDVRTVDDVDVFVGLAVGTGVGVGVGVSVGVKVFVAVCVGTGVDVGNWVGVRVGVEVFVGVTVGTGVIVGVGVVVAVSVGVGVAVGQVGAIANCDCVPAIDPGSGAQPGPRAS